MVDTIDGAAPGPAPAPERGTSWADRVRFVVRGIGQTLITAGVVVLLFVVYEVYVTNYFAHEEQHKASTALQHEFKDATANPELPLPGQKAPSVPDGKGIAFLYIPRLGRDYSWAIVQGTNDADLEKGPGHYKGTALPGQVGNFAVAGHRVGKGEPFLNLDHLRVNDAVIVETQTSWFVYRVKGQGNNLSAKGTDGIPGREIVSPSDSDVLQDVPDHPGQKATEQLMTMTTCHPKFTAAKRMIVYAALDKSATVAANGTTMPASIAALYNQQES